MPRRRAASDWLPRVSARVRASSARSNLGLREAEILERARGRGDGREGESGGKHPFSLVPLFIVPMVQITHFLVFFRLARRS